MPRADLRACLLVMSLVLAAEALPGCGSSAGQTSRTDEQRLKEWDAQLRAKEAALTARSQQLEEEAEQLKEYALALKAEEARLRAGQDNPAAGDAGASPPRPLRGHPPGKPAGEAP